MSKTWRIISFGSTRPNTYSEAARSLHSQCTSMGIDCYIPVIDFAESDRKSICLYKPTFILQQIRQYPVATLWLDCDASLTGNPSVPSDTDWDIGFVPNTRRRGTKRLFSKQKSRKRWVNPVSGFAVGFLPTHATLHFLQIWKYLCDWPDLASGGDHRRMCWARMMVDLKEINFTRYLQGSVIRDAGKRKEHDLRGLHRLKLDL